MKSSLLNYSFFLLTKDLSLKSKAVANNVCDTSYKVKLHVDIDH